MSIQRRKYAISVASLLAIALAFAGHANADQIKQYKFGVFPFMPMPALIKYYNSVSADFTRHVNKRVIAQSRPTFKLFSEEIEKETYDIIFVQPFDYPKAYEHNYRPLARRADNLDAILVTKMDSKITSIADLKGKIVAAPPKESAITIVMEKELENAGLQGENGVEIIYTGNHFACMQMVLVDKADVCSTTTPVLKHWENTQLKNKKFKTIHQAGSVPHTLYMAHTRVPEEHQQQFKKAILTWNDRSEGKMILKIFSVSSFIEAKDSDYDIIRKFLE
jgi:phosphonate transport system substrate-binding protein